MYSSPNFICQNTFLVCATEKTAEAELGGGSGGGGSGSPPPFPIVFDLYYLNPWELQISILSHLKNYPLDLLMLLY